MQNLLKETLKALEDNGKTPNDVLWVGDLEKKTTWENFARLAEFEYDNGFGGCMIQEELLIVGDSWWLERDEYNGSEWWEFKQYPVCKSTENSVLLNVSARWFGGLVWENKDET